MTPVSSYGNLTTELSKSVAGFLLQQRKQRFTQFLLGDQIVTTQLFKGSHEHLLAVSPATEKVQKAVLSVFIHMEEELIGMMRLPVGENAFRIERIAVLFLENEPV